jgi:hypothetical protein
MTSVWADDEEVIFEQGIPENPLQIYNLLMAAFSEQGRVVVGFEIDGEDALQMESFPEKFSKISAKSLRNEEVILRICNQSLEAMSQLDSELNILSTAWTEVFKQMNSFTDKIKPFADLMDTLGPYASTYPSSWSQRFKEIADSQADSLNEILSSFEMGNPAGLSDELSSRFTPLVEQSIHFFTNTVIPDLEKQISMAA